LRIIERWEGIVVEYFLIDVHSSFDYLFEKCQKSSTEKRDERDKKIELEKHK
jgi:hypothetical protein